MGLSNLKSFYRLLFVSMTSMVFLAACGQGIKLKEMKVQTQEIPGSPFLVEFESLKVSSLNGASAEGTIKFVLVDTRTSASRRVIEYVRGNSSEQTVALFQSRADEPTMTYSARCASTTCDRFELVLIFVAHNETAETHKLVWGIIQTPTETRLHAGEVNVNDSIEFQQVINATESAAAL